MLLSTPPAEKNIYVFLIYGTKYIVGTQWEIPASIWKVCSCEEISKNKSKTSNSVFRENRCLPLRIFSFFYCFDLEN